MTTTNLFDLVPLMLFLSIPILLKFDNLYEWTSSDFWHHHHALEAKTAYLNKHFFFISEFFINLLANSNSSFNFFINDFLFFSIPSTIFKRKCVNNFDKLVTFQLSSP